MQIFMFAQIYCFYLDKTLYHFFRFYHLSYYLSIMFFRIFTINHRFSKIFSLIFNNIL